jgi:hypothetical protein
MQHGLIDSSIRGNHASFNLICAVHKMTEADADLTDDVWKSRYKATSEHLNHVREIQAAYGRWLLASLLAAHTGAILAITQTGSLARELFAAVGPSLVWGIVATLIAGGLTWLNYSASFIYHFHATASLREGQEPRKGGLAAWTAAITFFLAPAALIVSFVFLIFAAQSALGIFYGSPESLCIALPKWISVWK